uniref:phosphoethanolamine N-methyltransferase-like n=1 Tax=Styela clava TaxID=7725 RepID=UPI00193ACAF5|nr:phosphoethanolamine N-methyltransferase-like [Styela clava]
MSQCRHKMNTYWEKHSQNGDVTEMLLDSKGAEISDIEIKEIMNYLPDYKEKDVLELGAGIGRYTTKLAEKAKSVIAVDFMKNFIDKNKETNGHNKNIQFVCKNVLELELETNSLDLIFSNWLLMYLDDHEVSILFHNMLKWLKPTGRLFYRESCYKQSDVAEPSNTS